MAPKKKSPSKDALRKRQERAKENPEKKLSRLKVNKLYKDMIKENESLDQRKKRMNKNNEYMRSWKKNASQKMCLEYEGFNYKADVDYASLEAVNIGLMTSCCGHCHAYKFRKETMGLCCSNGKIDLPLIQEPPKLLVDYTSGESSESKHFLRNIRKFNSCFQMTSFGASKICNHEEFLPTFKIQGQVYHTIGSLLPEKNMEFKFLQIYFMGDEVSELNQRCKVFTDLNSDIILNLQRLLHKENHLIKIFKYALENLPSKEYKILIKADKIPHGEHKKKFCAPSVNDVAIIMVNDNCESRDIVLEKRNASLQRIRESHRYYDALQYPLLFCRGEDGYHFNIYERNTTKMNKVTMKAFYAYRLMLRPHESLHIFKCKQLFLQFLVDVAAKIESQRLWYIRLHQTDLRSEEYIHLRDAILNDVNVKSIGKSIILPSSHIGSPRHMHEYSQDAMTYVRKYGRPDLFITFTCNPNWSEIIDSLLDNQTPQDRPDIITRVFYQKLKNMKDLIVKCKIYGNVLCWMYSVEWQKRGLPHAHMLVWLEHKIKGADIDHVICAELPDPELDPELFEIIKKHMIHGPCGSINPQSPCMKNGHCTKRYPREMISETQTGGDGYPLYRRRKKEHGGFGTSIQIKKVEIDVDNRWVVPYSPLLCKIFKAHINVEYCNSVKAIKYICKYIYKGCDMAVFGTTQKDYSHDEVTRFQMGRYICSSQAAWLIFGFHIHERFPAVTHLDVHLPNFQRVCYTEANAHHKAEHPSQTTLIAFFDLCKHDHFARTLLYHEVPSYYTWNKTQKKFFRRKRGIEHTECESVFESETIGRVYIIHPSNAECYFLRLLLHHIRGPTSFDDLKTVNGDVLATFRETCLKLGLLENDEHWHFALNEAVISKSAKQLRSLFAMILTICNPSDPLGLWDKYRIDLSEDISYKYDQENISIPEHSIFNEALCYIEDECLKINNKLLNDLGIPSPNRNDKSLKDRDYIKETTYDCDELKKYVECNKQKCNDEQLHVYESVMVKINGNEGGIYFLDAPGGTGKTFLLNLLLSEVRSQNKIALAVASSGIASTLLEGGRTAHSMFKLPMNIDHTDHPTCNIKKNTSLAKVLQECKLIVWDECTMANKNSLEALNHTLMDLKENDKLMGGTLILLAGDFRQILPVLARSTPCDEINACLKSSYLWKHVTQLSLTMNMRIQLENDESLKIFAGQLLMIGAGKIDCTEQHGSYFKEIFFPDNFCKLVVSIEELISMVFPKFLNNYKNAEWLINRAILAPRNEDVNKINDQIQQLIPGAPKKYTSIDSVVDGNQVLQYPIEFLNSLEPPGMPPHILSLKIGAIVMVLRNLNPPKLCNGTRLIIKNLSDNILECTIINGKFKGEDVFIPRIPMITSDLSIEFKRLQFPIRLAFAITINKAQGQSLKTVGINLEKPCFSHGQLYVACSRVGNPKNLVIYNPNISTKNVVYPIVLQ